MKLTTRDDMTPEFIAASQTHTKAEKLEVLETMRRDTLKKREDGAMGESEADDRLHDIDNALEAVKREGESGGIVLGRATSA